MPDPLPSDPPAFGLTFPEEEAACVADCYQSARAILEYGSGGSTVLAAAFDKPCTAVESDPVWADKLTAHLHDLGEGRSSANVFCVDIGPTKEWGYPRTSEKWHQYWRYPLAVWDWPRLETPDVVLIDGRMRTACFAAVMLKARTETLVLFDDYTNRAFYHGVERYVTPDRIVGRLAQFTVRPGLLSPDAFADVMPWFFSLR